MKSILNGQICPSSKIKELSDNQLFAIIKSLIDNSLLDCGSTMKDPFYSHTITRTCDKLNSDYSNFHISEVASAFERGIEGEFGKFVKVNFQNIASWLYEMQKIVTSRYLETQDNADKINNSVSSDVKEWLKNSAPGQAVLLRLNKFQHLLGDEKSFIEMSNDIKKGKYKKELTEIKYKNESISKDTLYDTMLRL